MESYHICNARTNLAPRHRAMLEQGSAIAPDVIAESGARSIRGGSELPNVFSERQRRLGPGVLYVVHRPSEAGGTSYCFRPDRPDPENPGNKYQQPSKARGGVGNVLDVLPSQRHLINDTSVPVIFVEGAKKMLSVVSAAREAGETVLVVAIVGVWNWLHRPDGKNSKPIPDMLDIPLQDRRATVMFDSDVLGKWQVQQAAGRLAEYLEGRGADVFVTYFHDMPDGSKCGADDYLASGGTFAALRLLTRRYDPADFVRLRLERDERLRAAAADLGRRFWSAQWKGQSEHSARDVLHVLIEAAVEYGRVLEDGVEVMISWGTLQLRARLGSAHTVKKAIAYLESEGIILRRVKAENARKSGGFVLAADTRARVQYIREEGNPNDASNTGVASMYACTALSRGPRMMWSSPGSKGRRGTVRGTRKVRQHKTKPRPARRRPAKVRGHLTDALEHAGGSMTLVEVAVELGVPPDRIRELTRRKRPGSKGRGGLLIWYIDAGIITLEDGVVSLTDEWLTRVNEVREAGGEIEAADHDAVLLEIKRAGYHDHLARRRRHRGGSSTTPTTPTEAGLANIAESRKKRREHQEHQEHQERDRAAREARERADREDREKRERVETWVRQGMKREFAEEEVYGRPRRSQPKPETPPSEAPRGRSQPPKVGGVYVHGPLCACWLCDESEAVGAA